MFSRRNALIGWAAVQIGKRRLRRGRARRGLLAGAGKVVAGVAAVASAVGAAWLVRRCRRGRSTGGDDG